MITLIWIPLISETIGEPNVGSGVQFEIKEGLYTKQRPQCNWLKYMISEYCTPNDLLLIQNDTAYARKSQPPRKQRRNGGGRGSNARNAFERVVEDLNVSQFGINSGVSLG